MLLVGKLTTAMATVGEIAAREAIVVFPVCMMKETKKDHPRT